jgi:putative tricarboxylic transport membrane protein
MRGSVTSWKGEAGIGLALAAAGGAIVWLGWEVPRGDLAQPGPGAFPLALGLLLGVIGVLSALDARRRRAVDAVQLGEARALACAGALLFAALAFVPIGFVPTGFLFLTLLFRLLAKISWPVALLAAGAVTAMAWAVFVRVLEVQLPSGLL